MKTPEFYVAPNGDVHINAGPQPVTSPRAVAAMCEIDAAADREWLEQNPEAYQRVRPSSFREIVALGLPVGSTTVTTRGKYGSQIRMFVDP